MKEIDIDLKCCPFCGGVARIKVVEPLGFVFVECCDCHSSTKPVRYKFASLSCKTAAYVLTEEIFLESSKRVAAKFWNKRVNL